MSLEGKALEMQQHSTEQFRYIKKTADDRAEQANRPLRAFLGGYTPKLSYDEQFDDLLGLMTMAYGDTEYKDALFDEYLRMEGMRRTVATVRRTIDGVETTEEVGIIVDKDNKRVDPSTLALAPWASYSCRGLRHYIESIIAVNSAKEASIAHHAALRTQAPVFTMEDRE